MKATLRVLFVEDSPEDAELILHEIRQGGYEIESERVEARAAMETALTRQPWDIILSDNSFPRFSAMEAISLLKEKELDTPLIVVSGTLDEETAVTLLKAGAQDFLVKGKYARLIPAIQRELKDAETRRARRRAEEESQQMQGRFRALTENAPDGVALIEKDGRMKFVSPAGRRMFGYELDDNLEINPAEHTHPDDLPAVLSALSNLIENPTQNFTLQYRFRHKDGSWRWIESTFTNLLSVKSVEAIVINFRDITERRQVEEKIRQQLDRLAALREIDQLIASTFDLRMSMNTLLSRAVKLLMADAAAVLLLDPIQNMLEYSIGIGFRTDAIQKASVRFGKSLAGKVAVERKILQIRNIAHEAADQSLISLMKDEGFVTYHGAPLIVKGKIIGVLEVYGRSVVERDQDWLDFFSTLAGQAAIMIEDARMFNDLQLSNIELTLAYDATIEGWSHALDLRDKETEGHTRRVTDLAVELARRIGLPEGELIHIRRGALLHDMGKLGIPDHILLKPDALSEIEWEMMKKHPIFAYELLSPIRYLKSAAIDIPYCHHEKWDGSGYPRGLKEEQIPLAARVFAVVDVWDAITSDRPYRPAWTREKAMEFIREQSGRHFDPQVVKTFLELIRESTGKSR